MASTPRPMEDSFGPPASGGLHQPDEEDSDEEEEEEEEEEDTDEDDEPTLAFDEEDTMTPAEQVKRYAESDIALQRLLQANSLASIANSLGMADAKSVVVPVFAALSSDSEVVIRKEVAGQASLLANFFHEARDDSECHSIILDSIVPVVLEMLQDDNLEVRTPCVEGLGAICELMSSAEVMERVFPTICELAVVQDEDMRCAATQALAQMAPTLDPEPCASQLLAFVSQNLATDHSFRVRKQVASTLGPVSVKLVGTSHVEEGILPLFIALCHDDIWGVRKSAVEVLHCVSAGVPLPVRASSLSQLMITEMLHDESRWVRNTAFEFLGQFIATLSADTLSEDLLISYTSMANRDSSVVDVGEPEMTMYAAFSFPGVLLTAGKEKWGELCSTYDALCADSQWKVRRSLAFSLHEVGKLLPENLTDEVMLKRIEDFIVDIDEVKVGIIANFADCIACLSPGEAREKGLGLVVETIMSDEEQGNWRYRETLSTHMPMLATLFETDLLIEEILPLAYKLCIDDVVAVRVKANAYFGPVLKAIGDAGTVQVLQGTHPGLSGVAVTVPVLASHDSHFNRMTYLNFCAGIQSSLSVETVTQYLLPLALALVDDRVANVRLAVVKLLRSLMAHNATAYGETCAQVAKSMVEDSDRDVRMLANEF